MASCAFDGTIKVWDLEGGKELKSFSTGPEKGPKDGILQVAWGADNKTLYACGFDKYLRVWDALEGKELEHYGPAPDDLYGLAVSKDGNLVATAGYGGNLRLYDVQSGKVKGFQLSEPKKKNMITYCIAFTPDGKAVVTGHEFGNAARVTPLDKFTDIKVEKEKPKPPEPKKDDKDKKETDKKKETKKGEKVSFSRDAERSGAERAGVGSHPDALRCAGAPRRGYPLTL